MLEPCIAQVNDTHLLLVRLEDIRDLDLDLGEGLPILNGRMQSLVDAIGQDIEDCCAVCDRYTSEGTLRKVSEASGWDDAFTAWASFVLIAGQENAVRTRACGSMPYNDVPRLAMDIVSVGGKLHLSSHSPRRPFPLKGLSSR